MWVPFRAIRVRSPSGIGLVWTRHQVRLGRQRCTRRRPRPRQRPRRPRAGKSSQADCTSCAIPMQFHERTVASRRQPRPWSAAKEDQVQRPLCTLMKRPPEVSERQCSECNEGGTNGNKEYSSSFQFFQEPRHAHTAADKSGQWRTIATLFGMMTRLSSRLSG